MKGTNLQPVGRCIYCGTTSGRLTREHVIPRMLAGNIVLPAASCEACQKITTRIEGYAGRRIFQDVRLKHGFRIKERPTHLPMHEEFSNPNEPGPTRLVPTKHVPGMLFLPNPEPPGIVLGKPPGSRFHIEFFSRRISDGVNDTPEVLDRLGYSGGQLRNLQIDYLGRFLAKIALGIGVAACGIDGFKSTISNIILKANSDWHHWIGGTTKKLAVLEPHLGQELHRTASFAVELNNTLYVVVQIQLLSYLRTPIYTAVVGELNEAGVCRLTAATK